MTPPTIILGCGYTGRFLTAELVRAGRPFLATSREPNRHLSHVPADRRVRFDLADARTWQHIPPASPLLWCFPAMPIDAVRSFAAAAGLASRRLVVLGSTSAYDVHAARTYPPPWIDESAPIDLTKPRVQGEELLRRHCAAIVLRVAGIYGPGRNPLDWIRSGRVGPSPKYVNFIHVEDLALSCLAALDRGRPGDVYNVGDGTPRTWEDLCQVARRDWGIAPHASPLPDVGGKRISAEKLRKELGVKMLHGDLYRELKGLQQPPAGKTRTDT